jgi:hypothetical protein
MCTSRWKKNVKVDLKETRWEIMDYFHLAEYMGKWESLVNILMTAQSQYSARKFLVS